MKNTNPIFSLKNFRSFGEEGADFELAPITVLTGCNSSGKSSLVKAILLLSRQSKIDKKTPMGEISLTGAYDIRDFHNISWDDLNVAATDFAVSKSTCFAIAVNDSIIRIAINVKVLILFFLR